MLAYKAEMLAGEHPSCDLERIPLNLADTSARQRLFAEMAGAKTLVITEGLVVYLSGTVALATDLAAPGFTWWTLDMVSPRLMTMLQGVLAARWRTLARRSVRAARGPAFFEPYGWHPIEVQSLLHSAKKLRRLSLWFWLIATFLPDPAGRKPQYPWAGICLFERSVVAGGIRL